MKKILSKVMIVLALLMTAVVGGVALAEIQTIGRADGSGSGSAIATKPSDDVANPAEAPAEFVSDLKAAKSKGWIPALMVGVLGVLKALQMLGKKIGKLGFLSKGRTAMLIAGGVTLVAAVYDVLAGGGSIAEIGVAGLVAVIGLIPPTSADK